MLQPALMRKGGEPWQVPQRLQPADQRMLAGMQFVLSVEVTRLGTYAMLPNSFLTPRSLVPYNEVRKTVEIHFLLH